MSRPAAWIVSTWEAERENAIPDLGSYDPTDYKGRDILAEYDDRTE